MMLGPWRWLLSGRLVEKSMELIVEEATEALGPWGEGERGAEDMVRAALRGMMGGALDAQARRRELQDVMKVVGKGGEAAGQGFERALELLGEWTSWAPLTCCMSGGGRIQGSGS